MNNTLTVVLPCLNEENTIEYCVKQALSGIENSGYSGEVIVADNGSTDNSVLIAKNAGAKIVNVKAPGYGAALKGGINASKSDYVIMGDSDSTYNFLHIKRFVNELNKGNDLVIGNRFKGGIEKKAMPFLNYYIGNPFLSFLAKKLFKSNIGDFHCGLRGFTKKAFLKMELKSDGMEFATEMIAKSTLLNLKISEVPTTLSVPIVNRRPHLKPFRDGFRHLKLMFTYSILQLSQIGILLSLYIFGLFYIGLIFTVPLKIGNITLSWGMLNAFENITLSILILKSMLEISKKLFPDFIKTNRNEHKNYGFTFLFIGLAIYFIDFIYWSRFQFGEIDENLNLKLISVGSLLITYSIVEIFRLVIDTTLNYFRN